MLKGILLSLLDFGSPSDIDFISKNHYDKDVKAARLTLPREKSPIVAACPLLC
jgi:hypothetical protein